MSRKARLGARVGVPWRSYKEETSAKRDAYDAYLRAIREAGGEPVEISLALPAAELAELACGLKAILLPGSPADVDPGRYGAQRHRLCGKADPRREETDFALLDHAFAERKPVLAICYGVQLLNVYLGGSLIQDIPSELKTPIKHDWSSHQGPEPFHPVEIERGSRLDGPAGLGGLARRGGQAEAQVNSSHHQAIREPGRKLRVVARAPDGVVEAVEFAEQSHWVFGVQWHPERMVGDPLAVALFREFVAAARNAPA
jgi:putative glutamine amidotransferase